MFGWFATVSALSASSSRHVRSPPPDNFRSARTQHRVRVSQNHLHFRTPTLSSPTGWQDAKQRFEGRFESTHIWASTWNSSLWSFRCREETTWNNIQRFDFIYGKCPKWILMGTIWFSNCKVDNKKNYLIFTFKTSSKINYSICINWTSYVGVGKWRNLWTQELPLNCRLGRNFPLTFSYVVADHGVFPQSFGTPWKQQGSFSHWP